MKYRSDPHTIRGSIAAVTTPFDADGELDFDGLTYLVDWQLEHGSHGISIGGSTGEPSAQTVAERATAIRRAAQTIADRVPFVPGTGSTKLDETLELTGIARDAGADAVLIITPYYAKPGQPALYEWYATVAREFPDLPVIAYNVPGRTAVDLAPETVERLFRDLDNFVGVKETTFDFEHFSRVMQRCGPGLLVWSGIELLCLPLLALGGAGFISATANLAPAACAALYDHWSAGEVAAAREIHFGLHPLVDLLFVETNPAPVKYAMHKRGLLGSPYVRPPLVAPMQSGVAAIERLLIEGAEYLSSVAAQGSAR